jgi:hypothetical protein
MSKHHPLPSLDAFAEQVAQALADQPPKQLASKLLAVTQHRDALSPIKRRMLIAALHVLARRILATADALRTDEEAFAAVRHTRRPVAGFAWVDRFIPLDEIGGAS